MASSTSNEKSVQGTNDSSIVGKCSMVKMDYFDDPFINCFVAKLSRRAPLINRGYYVRAKAVSSVVSEFLQFCIDTLQPAQIISLGAGFDSLFFRISMKNRDYIDNGINFIEVDFPNVAKRKRNLILNNKSLLHLLKEINSNPADVSPEEYFVLQSSCYKLLGLDLSNINQLQHALVNDCHVSFSAATLFISECSITYMEENRSSALIKWASSNFTNSLFSTYEQINPNDGFGLIMLQHFESLGSPLRSIHKYPNLESQRNRYLNLGWERCSVVDMNEFYSKILPSSEKVRLQTLEQFDEFEEINMTCGHYVLTCASQGSVSLPMTRNICSTTAVGASGDPEIRFLKQCGCVLRYGHCSVLLSANRCVTVAGFGQSPDGGGHRRLDQMLVTDLEDQTDTILARFPENSHKVGRLHASATRLSDESFVILGGRSSPSAPCTDTLVVTLVPSPDSTVSNDTFAAVTKVDLRGAGGREVRWRHTASSVVVRGKLIIVVYGGLSRDGATLGDCHFIDPSDWSWTPIGSHSIDIPKTHSAASCSNDSDFVVSGGIDDCFQALNCVHILNCVEKLWSRVNVSGLLPRYSHTAHVWQKRLYLLGGVNNLPGAPPGIGIVDLATGLCVELPFPAMSNPYIMCKHSSILDEPRKRIIVLGGGANCFSFGTHLNPSAMVFDLDKNGMETQRKLVLLGVDGDDLGLNAITDAKFSAIEDPAVHL